MSLIRASVEAGIREQLGMRLDSARRLTDTLFQLVRPEAIHDRPIPERHRIIFYLGHLEAFDLNMVGRYTFERDPFHPDFDRLFELGIDPTDGHLPDDHPEDWPPQAEIRKYKLSARQVVDTCLKTASFEDIQRPVLRDGLIFKVAIEHRLMHAETMAYMLNQLPLAKKVTQPSDPRVRRYRLSPQMIEIPAGSAQLGLSREASEGIGWDNEFEAHQVQVPAFRIDKYDVTNGQFLEFVRTDAYNEKSLWDEGGWDWLRRNNISYPRFWFERQGAWSYRSMFAQFPLPLDWPVYVSHAEASAYARWAGKSLPTEAQWHRAACGTADGREREYPWGPEFPDPRRGNFDFSRWDPTPVGSFPSANSAFGVSDLVGNGWEWTSTRFRPFEGFTPFPFYPGYSAAFFDDMHYVMKGGSPRTAACLLRKSYRNWFQPYYPYVYAAFRCVEN